MMKVSVAFIFFTIVVHLSSCVVKTKQEKMIALGRQLFFDNNLSYNNTRSCATCHNPEFAFTDSYKKSTGIYADETQRNSRPLFNLQHQKYFTAADSTTHTLERQMRKPLFAEHPKEMGMTETLLVERVASNKNYVNQLAAIFPNDKQSITADKIIKVIATYVASIKSNNSKYDLVQAGKSSFTEEEAKGQQLFIKNQCNTCHGGDNFDTPSLNEFYFNTGLYNTSEPFNYPATDLGLYELTKQPKDVGKYKVPTLRNLQFTAPYYHDGSEASLLQVLEDYNRGGKLTTQGVYKGDGALHKNKHTFIRPLNLSMIDKQNLLKFLLTLTDSTIKNK